MALRLSSLPSPLLWHGSCSTFDSYPGLSHIHLISPCTRIRPDLLDRWKFCPTVAPIGRPTPGPLLFRHRPASHPWFLTAEPQHRTFAGLDARNSGAVVGVSMSASCAWSIYHRQKQKIQSQRPDQRQKQPASGKRIRIRIEIRNTSPKQKRKAPPTPKTAHLHTN